MPKKTVRDAVVEAMRKFGFPITAKEAYEIIIEFDYYRFNAERPDNIVKSEIRRHCEGVDFPTAKPNKVFKLLKDGKYWINGLPVPGATQAENKTEDTLRREAGKIKDIVDDLKSIHQKHTIAFKQTILNQLKQIEPETFERFSRGLLEIYGFVNMEVTKRGRDGGIDGFGNLKVGITHLNVAFQCKRWKANVGRTEIDKFRGAIQGEYEQGIFFTTATFSKEATGVTIKKGAVPVILIDGPTLVDIMIEKRFGIDFETMPVYINALDRVLTEEL